MIMIVCSRVSCVWVSQNLFPFYDGKIVILTGVRLGCKSGSSCVLSYRSVMNSKVCWGICLTQCLDVCPCFFSSFALIVCCSYVAKDCGMDRLMIDGCSNDSEMIFGLSKYVVPFVVVFVYKSYRPLGDSGVCCSRDCVCMMA